MIDLFKLTFRSIRIFAVQLARSLLRQHYIHLRLSVIGILGLILYLDLEVAHLQEHPIEHLG